MFRRSVRTVANEHPVDKRKDDHREQWQLRLEKLLNLPERSVHDGKRHLVRDVMRVID